MRSASPRIQKLSWGRIEVTGREIPFKDAKLFPGGAREWDWSETGTHHRPGIQPEDVEELLDHGASVVVLSTGIEQRLGVCQETLARLQKRNIEVHVLETREAVVLYNRLAGSRPVGGLFHSTC